MDIILPCIMRRDKANIQESVKNMLGRYKKRLLIILSSIILIAAAFGYGYYVTMKKILKEVPQPKPGERIDVKEKTPVNIDEKGTAQFPSGDRVTPSTVLVEKIVSINTGNIIENDPKSVPDEIVNFDEEQVKDYFSDYDAVMFSKDKITVERKFPNLPDCFLVKLEDDIIKVFVTDDEGQAVIFNDFTPVRCKNKDETIEKGIEVKTLDEVYSAISDYE